MLMNTRALAVVGMAALCTMAPPLAAQAQTGLPSTFCLRGQPLRSCRSYLVFELTGTTQLTSTSHEVTIVPSPAFTEPDLRSYVAWNIGAMENRDSTHALGASLEAGVAFEGGRVAIKGRRRTWLANNDAFDVAAGVLATSQQTSRGGSVLAYGLTAESAFGLGDQVSVAISGDLVRSRERGSAALKVGLRLGSYTAMAATGLIAVGVAVIASTIHSID
jgi:hypothetical protein